MDIILQSSEGQFYDLLQKIETGEIQQCNGFLVREPKLSFIKHYFTYAETDEFGIHWFFVTMSSIGSVKLMNQNELYALAKKHSFTVEKIIPFYGNFHEQKKAFQRGMSCVGKSYQWVGRNCENLMNYIQTGRSKSIQTRNVAFGIGVAGGFMMVSKNKSVQNFGIATAILGIGALLIDSINEHDF
jgi:hypothetical protein